MKTLDLKFGGAPMLNDYDMHLNASIMEAVDNLLRACDLTQGAIIRGVQFTKLAGETSWTSGWIAMLKSQRAQIVRVEAGSVAVNFNLLKFDIVPNNGPQINYDLTGINHDILLDQKVQFGSTGPYEAKNIENRNLASQLLPTNKTALYNQEPPLEGDWDSFSDSFGFYKSGKRIFLQGRLSHPGSAADRSLIARIGNQDLSNAFLPLQPLPLSNPTDIVAEMATMTVDVSGNYNPAYIRVRNNCELRLFTPLASTVEINKLILDGLSFPTLT